MGLKLEGEEELEGDLGIGTTNEDFQSVGKIQVVIEELNIRDRGRATEQAVL